MSETKSPSWFFLGTFVTTTMAYRRKQGITRASTFKEETYNNGNDDNDIMWGSMTHSPPSLAAQAIRASIAQRQPSSTVWALFFEMVLWYYYRSFVKPNVWILWYRNLMFTMECMMILVSLVSGVFSLGKLNWFLMKMNMIKKHLQELAPFQIIRFVFIEDLFSIFVICCFLHSYSF